MQYGNRPGTLPLSSLAPAHAAGHASSSSSSFVLFWFYPASSSSVVVGSALVRSLGLRPHLASPSAPTQSPTTALRLPSEDASIATHVSAPDAPAANESPQMVVKPTEKCNNYPVCTRDQKRPRVAGAIQPRLDFCSTCFANPVCSEDGCNSHVPLGGKIPRTKKVWSPNGRCVKHMRAAGKACDWTFCGQVSCDQLAMQYGKGKCYACSRGFSPAAHVTSSASVADPSAVSASVPMISGATASTSGGQVPFRPECACCNYPMCTGVQKRPRVVGVRQYRVEHCSTCLASPVCKEIGCINHVPPGGKVPGKKIVWSPDGRCAEHNRLIKKKCGWISCSFKNRKRKPADICPHF